ncbi:MAG: TonB-dependent receptor [Polyangiaceae bacterium]|nr:TonB-dependent receptor [Polyangiaceae bacterium]
MRRRPQSILAARAKSSTVALAGRAPLCTVHPVRPLRLLFACSYLALAMAASSVRAQERAPAAEPGAAADEITPPRLTAFHQAEYPPQARELGLEADVELELTVGADGVVQQSRVVTPAGHGFDEAAQQASLEFVFAPARRNGQPVAARIRYRYEFRQARATEPSPPARRPPPPRAVAGAELKGRVVTGSPPVGVAGAHVILVLPDGTTWQALTDTSGAWSLESLPSGSYHLDVVAPGHAPLGADGSLKPGVNKERVDRLVPQAGDDGGEPIEVSVHEERPAREVTRRTLSARELGTMPGSMNDAMRALQNLPGVTPTPVGAKGIIVRGTEPQDSLSYIDDLLVLDIYHLWGLSSVVPTEMLERLDFYPGNYSVKHGRGLAGLVNAKLRDPKSDGELHGMAQVDLIDARGVLEGPVPGLGGVSFIGGVRRSHLDTVAMPVLGWSVSPIYDDYQLFLVSHPDRDSRLRFGVIGADDAFHFSGDSGVKRLELDQRYGFFYLSSSYETRLSDRVDWSYTAAVGRIYQRFDFQSADVHYSVDAPAYPIGIRTDLGWRLGPRLSLDVGTDLHYAPFRARLRVPRIEADQGQPAVSTAYDTLSDVDANALHFRPAAYAELTATPIDRARLVGGVRLDYSYDNEELDISPRLNARYDLACKPERTTLKGGVGLFYQAPQPEQVLTGFGTPGLGSSRAVQSSLGVEQEFGSKVEASIEGFHYLLSDLVERRVASSGDAEFANTGSGHTLGLESLVRIKPSNELYGWLAYTLSRSVRRAAPGEPLVLYEGDSTHVLTALASYGLGRGWEVGTKFILVSGTPYTPVVGALYSSSTNEYVPVLGRAQSRRLPAYHELDLRAQKRWTLGTATAFTVYVEVINAYGTDRVVGIQCSEDVTRCNYQKHPMPILPSVGLRGEF